MLLTLSQAKAQLSFSGQLRTRSEFRNGTGTLATIGSTPSFFTSQRTRLTFHYRSSRLVFQTTVQDVRVWGQDASTINNADGTRLGIHEAWAEIVLSNKKDTAIHQSPVDYFGIKIGRQELIYDDSRLLGNLDWLQQARRHDAAVFKLLHKGWQTDLGVAFNQNSDGFNYNGTFYTPGNVAPYVKDSKGNLVATPAGLIPLVNASGVSSKTGTPSFIIAPGTNGMNQDYKAFQYLYVAKKIDATKITGLFFTDQFGKYVLDSVKNIAGADTGYVYGKRFNQKGVNARFTYGINITSQFGHAKEWTINAAAYGQSGNDKDGLTLGGYTTTASLSYTERLFVFTAGWDVLSGNDAFSTSTANHRFDPLYGTPHKFWGYMDYFYTGAPNPAPAGGLSNPYCKIRYTTANKRWSNELVYNYFALAKDMKDGTGNALPKYLGSEFDFVSTYQLNKITTLEGGLAFMNATTSMEYAKGITPGTARLNGNWAYLQINIKPEFLIK
ncbi:hypothetical protein F5148DRAFT_1290292 [Russula earlei]|uniref:Uncharacterized protein n=1 Tax=Russula earlei TaxID=71964 RepID=A0ACC0TWK1_9AGAM|nr:hypothetical protein F5148DRAFT_1290292 [Russula earlei]